MSDFRPLVDWSPCSPRTACPKCSTAGQMEVRQVMRAKPFTAQSLSGNQIKTGATVGWEYRCLACGDTGPAEPKESAEEQERLLGTVAPPVSRAGQPGENSSEGGDGG